MSPPPTVKIEVRVQGEGVSAQISDKYVGKFDEGFSLERLCFYFIGNVMLSETASSAYKHLVKEKAECIFKDPQIKIFEDKVRENEQGNDNGLENQEFIADASNFDFKWKPSVSGISGHYSVQNQGIQVLKLYPTKCYIMEIKQRTMKFQRADLLFSLPHPITVDSAFRYNIYVEDQIKNCEHSDYSRNISNLIPKEYENEKFEVLIGDDYVEVNYNRLVEGILERKTELTDSEEKQTFDFMNYLVLRIRSRPQCLEERSDKDIRYSFDAVMKKPGAIEKNRLKSYIKLVHKLQKEEKYFFYAPFINICQSSGSGKSKIAAELMLEAPCLYVVLREEDSASHGYPEKSLISDLFLNIPRSLKDEATFPNDMAHFSIVGMYLLLLKALFTDYFMALRSLLSNSSRRMKSSLKMELALKTMYKELIGKGFFGNDLEIFKTTKDWSSVYINKNTGSFSSIKGPDDDAITISNTCAACFIILTHINRLYRNYSDNPVLPFILILDEASLLTVKMSEKEVNFFRLFRRAVNLLDKKCNFVVLTLGTNSDILDLNPEMTLDSSRPSTNVKPGRIFPPFIPSRNWDISFNYDEMINKPIGYHEMVYGRIMIFWMSLGRPLWSSIPLEGLMVLIQKKIFNNSKDSGEAYLAMWMIRVGLLVHPAHVVTKHLVKSLMATLVYTSNDLSSMRAFYPSEPALAVGSRSILNGSDKELIAYYEALEKFVNMRAIDSGRFTEIIYADICLLTAGKAKKEVCNWSYNEEDLPEVCQAEEFILERGEFHLQSTRDGVEAMIASSSSSSALTSTSSSSLPDFDPEADLGSIPADIADLVVPEDRVIESLNDNYIVTTVAEYVKFKFGEPLFEIIDPFLPQGFRSARLNLTHFTQMSINFPFDTLEPFNTGGFQLTKAPVVDANIAKAKTDYSCCQITSEVLETMIMRGSGGMFAQNTFGLDFHIPVCLKPDEVPQVAGSQTKPKPEYSYIGIQVKRGKIANIRAVIAKGAVSSHYVRCGLHGASCPKKTCKFRLPDRIYKKILENGLIFVHAMAEDIPTTDGGKSNFEDEFVMEFEESSRRRKRAKKSSADHEIIFESSHVEFKNLFTKLTSAESPEEEERDKLEKELHDLAKKFCPPEFKDYEDRFKVKPFVPSHYDGCRFVPDMCLSIPVSASISVHVMYKRHLNGLTEKLTAIYSRGLDVYSTVLPSKARETARRVIFNELSMFKEVSSEMVIGDKPSYKYTELVSGLVSRNNGSSIPIANNFIRRKYNLPEIPDLVREYSGINSQNIGNVL